MEISKKELFDLATELGLSAEKPDKVRAIAVSLFDLALGTVHGPDQEPPRTGDPVAPYGYTDDNQPIAPYGYKRNGRPALKRGRTKQGGMALVAV